MPAPKLNRPLWLESAEPRYPALSGSLAVDVAVIGAGISPLARFAPPLRKAAGAC